MSTSPNLSESLRRSSRAVAAAQVATQVVSLGVLSVLYRLLGLEPYGLIGMVLPVLALLRILVTSGLDVATIQQPELADSHVSALFWINQAGGIAVAALMAASAPWLVRFYTEPDLLWPTVALAGTLWLNVLSLQHLALLQRKLRLGAVAAIRLAALVLAGVAAIAAAAADWGVWALVLQQHVELVALAALAWAVEPWRPGLFVRGAEVGRLLRFGGHCTFGALMFGMIQNVDKILVACALPPQLVALYREPFNLMMKPVTVVITPLTGIMLPGLSRAADDPQQYRRLLLRFFRFIGLVMLPAGAGLAVVGPEVYEVLGGEPWKPAGSVLSVLALSILAQGFFIALGSVFTSSGHADRVSKASFAAAAVFTAMFVVGLIVSRRVGYPVLGMAWTYTLTLLVIVFPAYLFYALKTVHVRCRDWLVQFIVSAPAALGMALAVLVCRRLFLNALHWPALPLLAAEVAVGVATYTLLAWRDIRWFLREGLRADGPEP
ncbi:MAG: oligosaccharide flippase family protein [Pirellulales bacterium]|nr:oligosaccharide flippase family protein [Pirellulales bacterium]